MNDTDRTNGFPGGSGSDPTSEADYRVREMEARLHRRLSALEGQNRRMKWMTVLSATGFVVALVAMATVSATVLPENRNWSVGTLSAEEVVLRDLDGVERGRMATDADGRTELTLSDREGGERIRLTVLADGSPGVTISDPDARPRAVLGYLPDGTTNLVLADARGVSRAVFGLESDGSTRAVFTDRAGAVRALMGVGGNGEPSVSIVENDGTDQPVP